MGGILKAYPTKFVDGCYKRYKEVKGNLWIVLSWASPSFCLEMGEDNKQKWLGGEKIRNSIINVILTAF